MQQRAIYQPVLHRDVYKQAALDHFHGMPASGIYKTEQCFVKKFPFILEDGIYRFDYDALICGKEHQSDQDCEHEGLCRVSTEKQLKDETFQVSRTKQIHSYTVWSAWEKAKI